MKPTRLSYEDSCRFLQQHGGLDAGPIPPMPDHMPQYDDETPRVSFFRTLVSNDSSLANLTLRRTFFGRSRLDNASFQNTDLTESNLCWNDFLAVSFLGAVLAKADMRASLFSEADFTATDLRGADLRQSTFEKCTFTDALLDGAVLAKEQAGMLSLTPDQHRTVSWVDDAGDEPGGG